jgi:hypothetical protein
MGDLNDAEREAEARELARLNERDAERDAIMAATVKRYYPDGDPPPWFSRVVAQCRVEAFTAANKAVHYDPAYQGASGEAKHEAYHRAIRPAFAEAFAKALALARALAPAA